MTTREQFEASVALERARNTELVPVSATPMGILEMAVAKGADIETLTKLLELKERFDAAEARMAYVQAMSDFKKESIIITKDKDNKQYGSKYTSIGNMVNTVTPLLSKHGLSAEWQLDQTDGIRVGCTITHSLGHSGETKWMKVPQDTSGAKNPIQQIKSSVTYAKIATFEMACGLASKDGNLDDDGNGSGGWSKRKEMDTGEYDRLCSLIENAGSLGSLDQIYVAAVKDANDLGDKGAIAKFKEVAGKRHRELKNESR